MMKGYSLSYGILFFVAVVISMSMSASATGAEGENATMTFSHQLWTETLQSFVDDQGLVDYEALARDRAGFDRYVSQIETQGPVSDPERFPRREDRLAYYLNAYNALVFQGVLSRGPESVSVWRGLISGLNFFVRMKITVGGRVMSLKKLEDDLIRKGFQDPRVHAALNCASISCPRLPREAFEPDRLDDQLDAAMQEFVNDPRHVRVELASRTVFLSKIFDWYAGDFLDDEKARGRDRPTLLDYVNRYRDGDAQISRELSVKFLDYDKGINKQ